jgi:hypothetical protein
MKKLLALLLLSPLANADMDNICAIIITDDSAGVAKQIQTKKCERDNILQVTSYIKDNDYSSKRKQLLMMSNQFCRFDRNRDIEGNQLSCVLYSKYQRQYQRGDL